MSHVIENLAVDEIALVAAGASVTPPTCPYPPGFDPTGSDPWFPWGPWGPPEPPFFPDEPAL
ncbi:hypothetical protein [Sphingomonas sp. KR3-1]|uniref:hypothetical protein n=1 Tax=Sphingomonas sp. KR3-1 TaxID=3156611 RepID=UPI0032B593F0